MELRHLTVEELAHRVGCSVADLRALAQKAPKLYRPKDIPKKSGGTRRIDAPHKNLKAVQAKLLHILARLQVSDTLFGRRGTSPEMAAGNHVRKPLLIALDLKDFFPGISRKMVLRMLMSRGASREIADLICRLVTFRNYLPQGAPTSPCIARLVLHPAARHIQRAARTSSRNARSTIWVDDITVSGPLGLERLLPTLIRVLERHGFRVNPEKVDVMKRVREQCCLGIKVNNGVEPTSSYLEKYEREKALLGSGHPRCRGMKKYIEKLQRSALTKRA